MLSAEMLNDLVFATFTIAPIGIVILGYLTLTDYRRNNKYRELLVGVSLTAASMSAMFMGLVLSEQWVIGSPLSVAVHSVLRGTFGDLGASFAGILMLLAAVAFVIGVTIGGIIFQDVVGKQLAYRIMRPLWIPVWSGTVKEKITRVCFQIILLWLLIGVFIHPVNVISGYALFARDWMTSFAWTVGCPAIFLWWYVVMNTNSAGRTASEVSQGP